MRSRSWMAALAITAGLVGAMTSRGDEEVPVENTVYLSLQISGLGPEGGTIEIKPGHKSCRFEPVEKTIERAPLNTVIRLDPIKIAAQSTGADRDCSFEITIKEPGQPPKSFRRGLRLSPSKPDRPTPTQSLKCYLISPSLASKNTDKTPKR